MAVRKGGLGKGLDALFIDNTTDNGAVTLRISEIEPNRSQPRKEFDESALADLADSIREHGVIQPLLVRPLPTGGYQLVAGERRWRASRMAGLERFLWSFGNSATTKPWSWPSLKTCSGRT